MDYSISSGDNLWNIVKNNYDCSSNKEIQETVNLIVKENDIEDANKIYVGAKLSLPETDSFIKTSKEKDEDSGFKTAGEKEEKTRADKFDDWTNSEDNYEKSLAGEDVDEFTMFELDLSTYSSDLKEFAQEYIDKYDADGNGSWDKSEFIKMAGAETDVPEGMEEDMEALYNQLFTDLNIDDNKDEISAGEFASYLYAADLDWDNYKATDFDVASSIDGKLSYDNYQGLSGLDPNSDAHDVLQRHKKYFFDAYYAA